MLSRTKTGKRGWACLISPYELCTNDLKYQQWNKHTYIIKHLVFHLAVLTLARFNQNKIENMLKENHALKIN